MPKLQISHLAIFTAALGACTAARESAPVPAESTPAPMEEVAGERVGEAEEPSVQGWLCGGLCASAGGLACALVSDTCLTASVVTVGSTAIPCVIAVIGACVGTLACVSLCSYDTPGID